MIRTSILTLLLTTAVLASSSGAAPSGRGGLSFSFNHHGDRRLALQWNGSGHSRRWGRHGRYERHSSVIRPSYNSGHYEWRTERVWISAAREKVWTEPVVRTGYDDCGRRVETIVRHGRWEVVFTPGHYEERRVKVWVNAPTVVHRY